MKRTTKIAVGILLAIGILALSFLFLNSYIEGNIKSSLENNLSRINATYEKVDVKLLDRKAEVLNSKFVVRGKVLTVDTISLDNIKVWKYVFDKNLIAGDLNIYNPVIRVYNLSSKKKDNSKKKDAGLNKMIQVKKVNIHGGSFEVFEEDSTAHRFFAKIRNITIKSLQIDSVTMKKSVPFSHDYINLEADTVYYDLDKQHKITLGNLRMLNESLTVSNFKILPKYSKAGHQNTTPVEKDRYVLEIDSLKLNNFDWSMVNDTLQVKNSYAQIQGAHFEIFRNKLLPDDPKTKPLYSKMLREMPVKISVDSIHVENAMISYEEKIHADRPSGTVKFNDLNSTIYNMTNIGLGNDKIPDTRILANANFMGVAPLEVDWTFNVANLNDYFSISGQMGELEAEQMNNFLKPAMNVLAEGEIKSMYFNFSGNDYQASGDMKLEYSNFKVEVLRNDGKKKNKVVSALANLIVKNKAIDEEAEYKDISFVRDQSKSFWNYFWNLIKNGALKAFL